MIIKKIFYNILINFMFEQTYFQYQHMLISFQYDRNNNQHSDDIIFRIEVNLLFKYHHQQMKENKLQTQLSQETAQLLGKKKSLLNHKIGGRYVVTELIKKAQDLQKNEENEVLIKTVLIQKIKSENLPEKIKNQRLAMIFREETILKKLNNTKNTPFIIPFEKVYKNSDFKLIITKFCNQGTLSDLINKFGSIQVSHAINILKQMVHALSTMNINGEINQILKPSNIYIHNSKYMIGDFGLSDLINGTQNEKEAAAPEVETGKYNQKADIYSLGALLFCMLYPKGSIKERYQKLRVLIKENKENFSFKLQNGQQAPQMVKLFLKGTLKSNPSQRIQWNEVINHCLFKNQSTAKKISSQYYKVSQFDGILEFELEETTNRYITNQINLEQLETRSEGEQLDLCQEDEEKVKLLRKTVSFSSEAEITKKLKILHVKVNFCQFLYKFLNQITNCKHFDKKSRNTIELIYLLSTRCLFCIGEVVDHGETDVQFNEEFKDYKKQNKVDQLHRKCIQLFHINSRKLTEYENKWRIKFYDFFTKRIWRQQQINKDKLMNGIQKSDYSKEEHIKFIQQKLNNIPRIQNPNQQQQRMFSIIDSFTDINLIDFHKLINQDFDQAINLIIKNRQ